MDSLTNKVDVYVVCVTDNICILDSSKYLLDEWMD